MNNKSLLVYIYLFSCFMASIVSVNATTVFGPQDFSINRLHFHLSYKAFNVDSADNGKLVITKTASDNAVKHGYILFHTRLIPLESFLREDKNSMAVKVKLHEKNRFIVYLGGSPGASITIQIEQLGSKPAIEHFTANPATIEQGASSTLNWSVSHADSISIAPEIGTVEPSGSMIVSPSMTTAYTLTASGAGETTTARTSITVTAPKPTVTIKAEPGTIAPGESSILSWSSTHADSCAISPDIGQVATSGSRSVAPPESTTYSITAVSIGGSATADVLLKVYPVKIKHIEKIQAQYTTPDNTVEAATSALHKQDIDWYYQTFTAETAAQDKKMFEEAGIDLTEKFNLVVDNDTYILDKIPHEDGALLVLEKRLHDIDGSRIKGWAGFVSEDGKWKVTYKYSQDESLHKYNDVSYMNCIASYSFSPPDFLEDSSWHGNDLTNINETEIALDKRSEEDLATAVFNGINTGLFLGAINDMPHEEISMGGWVKADNSDHPAVIIEIGREGINSTAIELEPGSGLRYWVHAAGRRLENTVAMDYDYHDNQWHHVFLTYDGAAVRLYLDAQLKDTQTLTGPIDSEPILNIGQRNAAVHDGTEATFKGRLDDIQIYNKALTADEIKRKFENGTTQPL